jgi:hypothetical protein
MRMHKRERWLYEGRLNNFKRMKEVVAIKIRKTYLND